MDKIDRGLNDFGDLKDAFRNISGREAALSGDLGPKAQKQAFVDWKISQPNVDLYVLDGRIAVRGSDGHLYKAIGES